MVTFESVALVAESEDFYIAGWSAVLRQQVGYATVLRATSLEQLEDIVARVPLHLAAVSHDMLGPGAVQIVRQWCERHPSLRVAIFTDDFDARELLALIGAGARGIIPRHAECALLLHALQAVSDGDLFLPPIGEHEHGDGSGAHENDAITGLTERQRQVIRLVSAGHQNKVIARELGISPSTVKVHVHAAFRALGVHSRTAAVAALRPRALEMAQRP